MQQHVLVHVVDVAGELGGFIHAAEHVGGRVGPDLQQPVIVQVLSDFNDGLPAQNAVLLLHPVSGFVVLYQHAHHVAARRFAQLVCLGNGLFYFGFYVQRTIVVVIIVVIIVGIVVVIIVVIIVDSRCFFLQLSQLTLPFVYEGVVLRIRIHGVE